MALSVKKTLIKNNKTKIYTIVESEFNPSIEQEAKEYFEEYKNKGWIVDCEYSSPIWNFKKDLKKSNATRLKFDIDMFKELKAALKTYAMIKRTSINPIRVRSDVDDIKKAIIASNGFNEKYLSFLEDEVSDSTKPYNMAKAIIGFTTFINHPLLDEIKSSMSVFQPEDPKVRKLVKYEDLLLFGRTIDDFQSEWTEKEKLLYYPIILWWRLTNIIPLRTQEFIDIVRDCLVKRKDGKFFIRLPREKQKAIHKRDLPIEDKVPINRTIYDLISDYIHLTDKYGDSEQLLSTKAYIAANEKNKDYSDYWHKSRLYALLKRFYDNIVVMKYGNIHNIERIKPMDTRHYAFMNLKLQGINELTIARLGGHRRINSQMHYQNHMDEFADSYVYSLTQLRRFKKQDSNPKEHIDESHPLVIKSRIKAEDDFEHFHKLDPYGACTYDLESNGCPYGGECRQCGGEYFYLSKEELKDPECIKWFEDYSRALGKMIREKIALMRAASKGMEYDFSNLEWFNVGDEELKTLSRDISSIMIKKSIVDSFLEDEFNE
ncbi:hypothetical protein [Peribacillus frigoritolerans]|uniref:hypothetical protein n=1 Tax=Peribacillus frigoritolerans TaxID=450367 RepID=UPI003305B0A2